MNYLSRIKIEYIANRKVCISPASLQCEKYMIKFEDQALSSRLWSCLFVKFLCLYLGHLLGI